MRQKQDAYRRPPPGQKRPVPKKRELFAIAPLIPHLFIIAIACGIYYFIFKNQYFPYWITYIYWGVKIIVGFEVLAAAASTLWGPILGIISGVLILFANQVYASTLFTAADAWQLIIVSAIGFLVTIKLKF